MCNTVVVADGSHELAILSAIDVLCAKQLSFTGYDVTRTARIAVGDFMSRHRNLKSVVRRAFQEDKFPDEYVRTLIDINGSDTFVYHPDTEDPYQYDSQSLFPDVSDGVTDNVGDDGSPIYKTNSECRLSIPKQLLIKMNLVSGDKVYLQKEVSKKVLKITGIPLTIGCDELTINKDGRVRISNTTLVDALGPTGLYHIESNDVQIATDIVISVTKI
ncbi:MAG: hypothetical protein J7L15_08250 [Clostridiales bacterium]|nr:hypothetical protein [Clostridiales bacterium]